MSKAARRIIDDCLKNDIGRLVVGYQETFQRSADMGKVNNQSFTSIPYGKLIDKLEYLCERYGIEFVKQEESYTSKASFWDKDEIPVYETGKRKEYRFSGKRTYRGMYETGNGRKINADVNGALNILRKSRVVSLEGKKDFGKADIEKRDILELYRGDIMKIKAQYRAKVLAIFDQIPGLLSRHEKRVVFNRIVEGSVAEQYEETFFWLSDSMIANECRRISDPNVASCSCAPT